MKSNDTFTNWRTRQVKMTRNKTTMILISITNSPDIFELFFQNTIIRFAGKEVHQTE